VVGVGVVQAGDSGGGGGEFGVLAGVSAEQAHVERGHPAVGGDLEHVVFFGGHLPGLDFVGASGQLAHECGEFLGCGHDNGFGLAVAQRRGGQL
jgi:hypothetical protein